MVRSHDDAPDADERASAAPDASDLEGVTPTESADLAGSPAETPAAAEPAAPESAEAEAASAESEPVDAATAAAAESEAAEPAADAAPAAAADLAADLPPAAAEPEVPAADEASLDPLAAAAAAARREAERVRAAEKARASEPVSPEVAAETAVLPADADPASADVDAEPADRPRPAAAPTATAAMPRVQEPRVRPAAPASRSARPAAAYGTVEPARSRTSRGGRRGIAVALVVILLFAAAGVGVYWFFFADRGGDAPLSADRGQRVALTLPRAQQVLEAAGMEAPDASQFHYVPTDNLVGPKFENVAVGDVVERPDGSGVIITRQVTADALFRNKGMLLTVPVTLTFAYDEAGETWREGDLELGTMTAQPLAAPNAALITDDLDSLLTAYDPAVGTLFAGVEPKSSSRLTTDGGTITVTMAKDEQVAESDAEGREHQLLKRHNCTAQIAVTWSDTEGWVAKVDRLNDEVTVEDLTVAQPGEGEGEGEGEEGEIGPIGQEGGRPEYGLKCSTGDLVELGGTVTGTPGSLTFKPDGGLRLTLDGSQRDVWAMGLKVGDGIDAGALVGRHVTVVGTISSAGLNAEEVTVG